MKIRGLVKLFVIASLVLAYAVNAYGVIIQLGR